MRQRKIPWIFCCCSEKGKEKRESSCGANTVSLFLINFLGQFYSRKSDFLGSCAIVINDTVAEGDSFWTTKKKEAKGKIIAKVQLLTWLSIWDGFTANWAMVALTLLHSQAECNADSRRSQLLNLGIFSPLHKLSAFAGMEITIALLLYLRERKF